MDDLFCARCVCMLAGIRIQKDGKWLCPECYCELKGGGLLAQHVEVPDVRMDKPSAG